MLVSQPRCLVKGASGHAPSRVYVLLVDDVDCIVSLPDGSRMMEVPRGKERVKHDGINAKKRRLWGIMLAEG